MLAVIGFCLATASAAEGPASAPSVAAGDVFPRLVWKIDKRVPGVLKSFTAPADPDLAFVSSKQGLWRTRDGGANWELVPRTEPKTLGTISSLAVCPARPMQVVLGTLDKGIFLSDDGGATWRPGGGAADGLAGVAVADVNFAQEDRGWTTILAAHGRDHLGLSKSCDGGLTWRVLSPRRYFRQIISLGRLALAVSAPEDEPENWSICSTRNYGEDWRAAHFNVDAVAGALMDAHYTWQEDHDSFSGWGYDTLWGCRNERLLIGRDFDAQFVKVGPEREGKWANVFVTAGPRAGGFWMWAYEPNHAGLLSAPAVRGAIWSAQNRGLMVDELIKRGANMSSNAIGTRFYACVNTYLYAGQPAAHETGPSISQARLDPPAIMLSPEATSRIRDDFGEACRAIASGSYAEPHVRRLAAFHKDMQGNDRRRRLRVTVRVEHPRGPSVVTQVRILPDLLGLPSVELRDDGRSGDGQPGDGLWGGEITVDEARLTGDPPVESRKGFPGVRMLPVTATDAQGRTATWSAPLGVFFQPDGLTLGRAASREWATASWGSDHLEPSEFNTGPCKVAFMADPPPNGRRMQFQGENGPWLACASVPDGLHDITGLRSICLEFRGSPGAGDVSFMLVDGLSLRRKNDFGTLESNHRGSAVPLLADGYLPAMDGKWHVVKVPALKLTGNVRFFRGYVAGFGLQAEKDGGKGTYDIGRVWAE